MRGDDHQANHLFSYVSPEARVPADHPLRAIRHMTDVALQALTRQFDEMYSTIGRPSIPPEHLLRALLLQVLYSVRSERLLMEQLEEKKRERGGGGERKEVRGGGGVYKKKQKK